MPNSGTRSFFVIMALGVSVIAFAVIGKTRFEALRAIPYCHPGLPCTPSPVPLPPTPPSMPPCTNTPSPTGPFGSTETVGDENPCTVPDDCRNVSQDCSASNGCCKGLKCTPVPGTQRSICLWDGPTNPNRVCGNAIVEYPELCDDGNQDTTDGCIDCRTAYCGDGYVQTSVEECDDGNVKDGDGCDIYCKKEPVVCGDGRVEEGEECDDKKNGKDCDGCTDSCKTSKCGDATLCPSMGEQCDDGNINNGDGCSSACKREPGCGNGKTEPELGEECDDKKNGKDCDECTDSCKTPKCGDKILCLLKKEECDDGNAASGDGCSKDCKKEVVPRCGNKKVEGNEECDDGNRWQCDGCTNSCKVPACGDRILCTNKKEECDQGPNGGPTCTKECKKPKCSACTAFCSQNGFFSVDEKTCVQVQCTSFTCREQTSCGRVALTGCRKGQRKNCYKSEGFCNR